MATAKTTATNTTRAPTMATTARATVRMLSASGPGPRRLAAVLAHDRAAALVGVTRDSIYI
jgi:hypothetical protein